MPVQMLTLWEQAPTTCFLGSLGLSMRHSSISPGTLVSAYMSLDFSIPLTLEVLCAVLLGEGVCPHKQAVPQTQGVLHSFTHFGCCCAVFCFGLDFMGNSLQD